MRIKKRCTIRIFVKISVSATVLIYNPWHSFQRIPGVRFIFNSRRHYKILIATAAFRKRCAKKHFFFGLFKGVCSQWNPCQFQDVRKRHFGIGSDHVTEYNLRRIRILFITHGSSRRSKDIRQRNFSVRVDIPFCRNSDHKGVCKTICRYDDFFVADGLHIRYNIHSCRFGFFTVPEYILYHKPVFFKRFSQQIIYFVRWRDFDSNKLVGERDWHIKAKDFCVNLFLLEEGLAKTYLLL